MQDNIFNTNPAQSAEPVQSAATEQPVIAGAPAPVASPAPGVPTQKKSKKGLIIGLIAAAVVVIALVVVFVVIKPFDKKISASTETEEDPNFSSVEKVIKAFVKNIKDEKYDKALSYVYGYGDEKANLKVTDASVFDVIKNNVDLSEAEFEYTKPDKNDPDYEEKKNEPFKVEIGSSSIDFWVKKENGKYYVYNCDKTRYGSDKLFVHDALFAVLSGTKITINGESSDKYKVETIDVPQAGTSNMVIGDMYFGFTENVDIYRMKVGIGLNIALADSSLELDEGRSMGVSTRFDREEYEKMKMYYVTAVEEDKNEYYTYAQQLLKSIFLGIYNKKDVSSIDIKFADEEKKKEFEEYYNESIDDSESEYYSPVTNYTINDGKRYNLVKLSDKKWLVQIEFDTEYKRGTRDKDWDLTPYIVLEKRNSDFYVTDISDFSCVFEGYQGR